MAKIAKKKQWPMAESKKEGVRQFVITQQAFGQDKNRRSRVDAQKTDRSKTGILEKINLENHSEDSQC